MLTQFSIQRLRMKCASLIYLITLLVACDLGSERVVTPAASGPASSLEMKAGNGFRLAIPAGIFMTRTDPVEGFTLYVVAHEDGTHLLTIYSGTAPSLLAPPEATRTGNWSRGDGVRCARWRGGASHECILSRGPMGLQVHAFYTDLPHERREVADQIIASIQLAE